jgi:uncharacterized membrane protein YhaH (DUF805 family)
VTTPSESRHDQVAAVYGTGSATATSLRPRVRRPPEAWAGAIFLTLAALPAAIVGALLGLQPGNINANLRARIEAVHTTVGTDSLITVFRAVGVTVLVLALLYVLFAWLAVAPRRAARAVVSALAAFEVVMLVAGIVVAGLDPVSLGVVLLAVAGTVLLYLPRTNEFLISNY